MASVSLSSFGFSCASCTVTILLCIIAQLGSSLAHSGDGIPDIKTIGKRFLRFIGKPPTLAVGSFQNQQIYEELYPVIESIPQGGDYC
jgi:hypothetical protein